MQGSKQKGQGPGGSEMDSRAEILWGQKKVVGRATLGLGARGGLRNRWLGEEGNGR